MLSQPTTDSDFSEVTELANKTGVQAHWGAMFKVDPTAENTLNVSYEDFVEKHYVQDTYDLVVLCSDVQPPDGLAELAQTAGIELADDGYLAVSGANGVRCFLICARGSSSPAVQAVQKTSWLALRRRRQRPAQH